jgi:hypothetical protein
MKEFRKSYTQYRDSTADFRSVTISIWCYRGNIATPRWKDVDTGESSYNYLFSDSD